MWGLFRGPLLDLRPGEWRLAALMATNYFLLLLFYYLLKPARDSMFLVELSPGQLPLVYILTALVAAPVTAAYARAGLKWRLDRLIYLTIAVLLVQLLAVYWLVGIRQPWVFYLFYSWVAVAGGLTTSQFWLQANAVYDAAEAKRVFPILGLGGIAGAFTGGEITGFLVRAMGLATRDLLLVAMVVLFLAGLLSREVWSRRQGRRLPAGEAGLDDRSGGSIVSIVRSIHRSRHLRLTVGIIALTVMTASFVDYQFKTVSWEAFPDERELTSFLGRFYGRMSLISLAIQALLAARLIRWLGVGGVLMVLPAVLALGAGGLFLAPGLMAGMLMRGGDISLKYSLDKTSRELLFLPIPLALKKRTKVFIDMFVDRWARGLAGGLLLLCTAVLKLDIRMVALLTLVLLAVWMVMASLMRREYVETFRNALSRREIDLKDLRVRIEDASAIEVLVGALKGPGRREILYALDMLKDLSAPGLGDAVRPLVHHESAEVRCRALEVLRLNGKPSDGELAADLLEDDDLGVRVAAVACLLTFGTGGRSPSEELRDLIQGKPGRRNAALAYISANRESADYADLVTTSILKSVMADDGPSGLEGRRVLAELPWFPTGKDDPLWDRLLEDDRIEVLTAAMVGVGRRGETRRLDWLLERLGDRNLRLSAREALIGLCRQEEGLIWLLDSHLRDPDVPIRDKVEIARIMGRVPNQQTVEALLGHLMHPRPELRFELLKAMGKLREGHRNLVFDVRAITRHIAIEAEEYYRIARAGSHLEQGDERQRLLVRVVGETQRMTLERVFRLLGLIYPTKDVLNAYHGVMSSRRILRANAQEFLDNVLRGNHRRLVLALIDEQPVTEAWRSAGIDTAALLDRDIRNHREALDYLASTGGPWLAACAIFAGGHSDKPDTRDFLQARTDEMLTPIEKVLILQNVDLFTEIPSTQLAGLASIAREVDVLDGDSIYRKNDLPDALYLVLSGKVRLHQGDRTVTEAGQLEPFGSWALFDDEPRVVSATAKEDTRLLRIDRSDFQDLLSDDVKIAQGIIRTVARRLRQLAGRVA